MIIKKYYINGEWINNNQAKIHIENPGFQYGLGAFETIRFNENNIFFINEHLMRLNSNLKKLSIKEIKENNFITLLNKTIKLNKIKTGLLKMIITPDYISYDNWDYQNHSIYVMIRCLPDKKNKVLINFINKTVNNKLKTLSYSNNIVSKKNSSINGFDEPAFINSDGFITECATKNIFFVKNKTILTPSLKLNVLPGIMRKYIFTIAKKNNLYIKEAYIKFDDIEKMEEAFLTSVGVGILPCYWENWNSNYILTKKINQILIDEYKIN